MYSEYDIHTVPLTFKPARQQVERFLDEVVYPILHENEKILGMHADINV